MLILFYLLLGDTNGCPMLEITENVVVVFNTSSEISLDCKPGFNLTTGDLHLECVNGIWVGELPVCSRKYIYEIFGEKECLLKMDSDEHKLLAYW